jgi:magnesium chelatase subunit D
MRRAASEVAPQANAGLVACLLAVDPFGLGGVSLRGTGGSEGEQFTPLLRGLVAAGTPFRRVPAHVADGRLLGGLDLAATLAAGRPILERGLLADADGGWIVLPMAERLTPAMAARLCAVLDSGEVSVERDGFGCRHASRLAVIALDEGVDENERPPPALLERLAIHLSLATLRHDTCLSPPFSSEQVAMARRRLPLVRAGDEARKALCVTAAAMGIASIRAPLLAIHVARVHAALCGHKAVAEEDALVAARLVLAPRATVLPGPEDSAVDEKLDGQESRESPMESGAGDGEDKEVSGELEDIVLEAACAAIPPQLLARLKALAAAPKSASAGGAGARGQSMRRGRPTGTRRGEMMAGARLNVVETLRAAAPWQKVRGRSSRVERVQFRSSDFRITRFKQQTESVTIFVVDASGSSALHRLAEAKGAVELLLADCYVRRDQVALIAFRGKVAELVLPPTRSLARAKRSLSALPGGGGTPIAAALDAVVVLADAQRRKGISPTIVLLTDGRANVGRDGTGGRGRAEADALAAARNCRAAGLSSVLLDTSPSPAPAAERLATEMGACYLPLPRADAMAISQSVRQIVASRRAPTRQ